jgi:hypothetical protein
LTLFLITVCLTKQKMFDRGLDGRTKLSYLPGRNPIGKMMNIRDNVENHICDSSVR